MAAVSPEQTGVILLDQLSGGAGEIPAARQQDVPKLPGRGLKRQRPERVAHDAQERRQMPLIPAPVNRDGRAPMLDGPVLFPGPGLAAETGRNGLAIDRPIRLGEVRQATHAHSAVPAQEPPHPNHQHARQPTDIPVVIRQRLQTVRPPAVQAVFRRLDLLMILPIGILLRGQ